MMHSEMMFLVKKLVDETKFSVVLSMHTFYKRNKRGKNEVMNGQ